MKRVHDIYDKLINIENIWRAWKIFQSGKSNKIAVARFRHNLENNLFCLREELEKDSYRHGSYERFIITDPKLRIIHKAQIRDRIIHTMAAKELERIYQPVFIANSFACQKGRGIHKALQCLVAMSRRLSLNYTRNFWFIKCDIRKFFDNIDQEILFKILSAKIADKRFLALLYGLLASYHTAEGKGLPLGNFTSQWLANIYLNELDAYIKHNLRIRYYLRYADDFIIMGIDRENLLGQLSLINEFLNLKLKLEMHEDKTVLNKFSAGIDFVGYKVLPHYILIRPRIRKRMLKNLAVKWQHQELGAISLRQYHETLNSYQGWITHCCGHKLANQAIYK